MYIYIHIYIYAYTQMYMCIYIYIITLFVFVGEQEKVEMGVAHDRAEVTEDQVDEDLPDPVLLGGPKP